VDFKEKLDPSVKRARKRCAKKLMRYSMEQLQGVVFLDAKKLWVEPGDLQVYMMDKSEPVEDGRLPQGTGNCGVALHYYAGVNAHKGVALFRWVTGTSGLNKGYLTLQVRPGLPTLTHALPKCDSTVVGTQCDATHHSHLHATATSLNCTCDNNTWLMLHLATGVVLPACCMMHAVNMSATTLCTHMMSL
jgi:hypothetical protein